MRRTPVRYALWSMLIIAPTMIVLPAFITTLADLRAPVGADTGPLTAVAAVIAFMITAFVAPVIVLPEARGIPALWAVGGIAGFIQLFAILFGYGGAAPDGALASAYIPGAIVCLNLFALIIIHAWVAGEGMGLSPAVGLATGLAYSFWIVRAGTSQEFNSFLGASAALLILSFAAAVVAAFIDSAYARTDPTEESPGRA